jgi:hypothetical protein
MIREEDDWEVFKADARALNLAVEMEKAGFDLEKYLQDERDKNVKPIDYYWQDDQADKPKPGA